MGRRSLVERVTPRIWMGQQAGEAADNAVAFVRTVPHAQTTPAAPAEVCVAAVMLRAKYSGLFRVEVHATFSDDMTADKPVHKLVAVPFASPVGTWANMVNATLPTGIFVGEDVPEFTPWNDLKNGAFLNVDAAGVAAAGIEVNGAPLNSAAAGAVVAHLRETPTLTGLLTANGAGGLAFDFSGIVMDTNNAPVPFTKGDLVAFGLTLTGVVNAAVITYENVTMSITEIPLE